MRKKLNKIEKKKDGKRKSYANSKMRLIHKLSPFELDHIRLEFYRCQVVCASRHAFIERSVCVFRSGIIVKCFFLVLSCTCHLQTKLNLYVERERIKQIHQPTIQPSNEQTKKKKFSTFRHSACTHKRLAC